MSWNLLENLSRIQTIVSMRMVCEMAVFVKWRAGLKRAWSIMTALAIVGSQADHLLAVHLYLSANLSHFRFICTFQESLNIC